MGSKSLDRGSVSGIVEGFVQRRHVDARRVALAVVFVPVTAAASRKR